MKSLHRSARPWAALLTLTIIAITSAIPKAYAQERYWDRGANNGTWSTSGNWSAVLAGDGSGAPGAPGQNDLVFFSATGQQGTPQVVTNTGNQSLRALTTLAGMADVTVRSSITTARELSFFSPPNPAAPAPATITNMLNGNELVLTWPNGQGWQLQAQTNTTGLGTSWSTISGATSPFTNTIAPANPTVFYRLSYSPIVITSYESITHNGTGTLTLGNSSSNITVQFRNNSNPSVKTNTIANNSANELLFTGNVRALAQPAGGTTTATALRNAGTGSGDVRFTGTIQDNITAVIQDSATSKMVIATTGNDYNGGNNALYTWNGPVLINAGTLALTGGANFGAAVNIHLAGGATYDVSGRSGSTTLVAGQALKVTGSASAGTIVVANSVTNFNIGNGSLEFTAYNGINAPLTVNSANGGTLTLAAASVVTVNTSSNLAVGTYKLIATNGSATVAGTVPSSATLTGASNFGTLSISNGELYLVVVQGYPVTYNGNNNDVGSAPANQTKGQGIDLTLASNSGNLARSGFAFAGWNTAANGSGTDYAAAATYNTDAPLTLFAKWTAATTYNITYNGNGNTGGTAPVNQIKVQGVDITLASNSGNLVKLGKTFGGWNTAANGLGTDYAVGATYNIDASVTLYAKWVDATWVRTEAGTHQWQATTNWSPAVIPNGDAITVNFTNNLAAASQVIAIGFELGTKNIGTMNLNSPGNANKYDFSNTELIFNNSLTGTGTINIVTNDGAPPFGTGAHQFQGQITAASSITNMVINNNAIGGRLLFFSNNGFVSSDPNNEITMTLNGVVTNGVSASGAMRFGTTASPFGPCNWKKLVVNGAQFTGNRMNDDLHLGRVPTNYLADAVTLSNQGYLNQAATMTNTINANRGITLGVGGGRINSGTADRGWVVNSIIAGTSGGALVKTGPGFLTLNTNNTYDGETTIKGGTLLLGANGSISNSSVIHIATDTNVFVGTILDVSARSSAVTLGSAQTLKTSGTLFFSSTIKMASANGVTMGATSGLQFADVDSTGAVKPLTVDGTGGSLTLTAGNVVTVTPTAALAPGSYTLIAKSGAGATVAGTAPSSVTVNAPGHTGSGASLAITGDELVLTIAP